MKPFLFLALLPSLAHADPKPLFNGKDLTGWEGDPAFWTVEDGAITGRTTPEKKAAANTFLIWKGGEVSDFEITFRFKMKPGDAKGFVNSGLQYRSRVIDPARFVVSGYQADFEYGDKFSGILYEEKGRGILAERGQKVLIHQGASPDKPKIEVTGGFGNSGWVHGGVLRKDDWNDYRVVAKGNHVRHYINGSLTVDVADNTAEAPKSGVVALQLHAGPPMQVQFKDIVLTEKP